MITGTSSRGYHLDAKRRPTFKYRYGAVVVEDFFEDVLGEDGRAFFRRTLRFDAPGPEPEFYFRAASGKQITTKSPRSFVIDRLELQITSANRGVVRDGDPGELMIPLTLPKGRSTLTLDYKW